MPTTRRALCVEDHPDTCEVLRLLLSRLGFEVVAADTTLQAMLLARSGTFELYVLDTWVGEKSGVELLKYIRSFDVRTPAVFFSAVGAGAEPEEALAAGAAVYVVKPDAERLIKVLAGMFPG